MKIVKIMPNFISISYIEIPHKSPILTMKIGRKYHQIHFIIYMLPNTDTVSRMYLPQQGLVWKVLLAHWHKLKSILMK